MMQCNYVPEMASSKINKAEAKMKQDKTLVTVVLSRGTKY
jgi:hypothetical protein